MGVKKIGIVLSGGGARGSAHVGVLKALEEHGISPQYVSGSSAGSIAATFYAAGKSPATMLEIAKNMPGLRQLFRWGLPKAGLTDLSYLKAIIQEHIPKDDFSVLSKKLYVIATNLNKGKWKAFQSGKLSDAVMASSALPLLFKPVEIDGEIYVDGGLLNNLPVEPLLVNCDIVIGVNAIPVQPLTQFNSLRQIGEQCLVLSNWANMESRFNQCDIQITVLGTEKYSILDFKKAEALHDLGYLAALKQMPEILKICEQ